MNVKPGHVTQIDGVEYHVAVIMPNGERQDWLLPARDAVRARIHADCNSVRLPNYDTRSLPPHSKLWRKLIRRARSMLAF